MKRILICEDDPDTAGLVKRVLTAKGYEVFHYGTGGDTIENASAIKADLCILDLGLPDMDGREICMNLRKNKDYQDTPIIMLTAMGEPTDKLTGLITGANVYMTKPFSVKELLNQIEELLRNY